MSGLHDDRCATRKGYPCNCASAAFERREYIEAKQAWELTALAPVKTLEEQLFGERMNRKQRRKLGIGKRK